MIHLYNIIEIEKVLEKQGRGVPKVKTSQHDLESKTGELSPVPN